MIQRIFLMTASLFAVPAIAASLPAVPTDPAHPGSAVYAYTVFHEQKRITGRTVDFFAPAEMASSGAKAPVIVFGAGQSLEAQNYQLMFEHLARKGYAVIAPQYGTGFFDQDWRRMAGDYLNLASDALRTYDRFVDPNQVIFSGHSKGGYVALVAAGVPAAGLKPSAVVLFAPAGFDSAYIHNLALDTPVTIARGDRDTIISADLNEQIYQALPSHYKQLITVASYSSTTPQMAADHYLVMTKSFFMGGHDGVSPFHFYGAFKWLIGAADDVRAGSPVTNEFIYGPQTGEKGLPGAEDSILRSW